MAVRYLQCYDVMTNPVFYYTSAFIHLACLGLPKELNQFNQHLHNQVLYTYTHKERE